MSTPPVIQGTLWYKDEATYSRFRELCDDKSHFAPPYIEWVRNTEQFIRNVEAQIGQPIKRIDADPEEFLGWCRVESKRPDTFARGAFAAFKANETHTRRN